MSPVAIRTIDQRPAPGSMIKPGERFCRKFFGRTREFREYDWIYPASE